MTESNTKAAERPGDRFPPPEQAVLNYVVKASKADRLERSLWALFQRISLFLRPWKWEIISAATCLTSAAIFIFVLGPYRREHFQIWFLCLAGCLSGAAWFLFLRFRARSHVPVRWQGALFVLTLITTACLAVFLLRVQTVLHPPEGTFNSFFDDTTYRYNGRWAMRVFPWAVASLAVLVVTWVGEVVLRRWRGRRPAAGRLPPRGRS